MSTDFAEKCPLCQGGNIQFFCRDKFREYLHCDDCALVHVPVRFHLSEEAEKSEYDLHQNDPYDPGYRRFLSRLFLPLKERLSPDARGLDFGCGPGPTLSLLFAEAGYEVAVYDQFYACDPKVFEQRYDFITATEVVEHLRRPRFELQRLLGLLTEGGVLGIMTKLVTNRKAFSSWHYKNDRSHICFFSVETFTWLAELWQLELEFIGKDVILLQKGRRVSNKEIEKIAAEPRRPG